jgi:glycosyltransferase involved in cell wall biosynthesis
MKPARVLLVGNFLSAQRGTRFYCEDLAERLAQAGCEVITTSPKSGRIARLLDTLWTVVIARPKYDVAVVDVYSGAGFWLAVAQVTLLRALRKHTVAVLHGGGLPDFHAAHPAVTGRFLRLPQAVVTPSFHLQKAFTAIRPDIVRVPNGMDLPAYIFRQRDGEGARICWLRAFDTVYDPVLAVRALAIVRARHPEASLTMAGPVKRVELLEATRRVIAQAGLADAVAIVGAVRKQDVPALLDRHDIFLNTPKLESFGVAVMEAAASGAPVVSTAAGEIPYLWRDGVDALLVPAGDEHAMGAAILQLLTDPAWARGIALAARAKAESCGWAAVLPQWLELLQAPARRVMQRHPATTSTSKTR